MVASKRSVSPSVPGPSPKGRSSAAPPGSIPTSHYDSSNGGKWDGQLPVAGILSQVPETWPSIIERDSFVDLAAVTLKLSACQTATFRRIAFRAGSASQGCFESQDNIARYLGYKRRAVQRALDHLQDLGLIHRVGAFHGSGKSNSYIPIFRLSHLRTSDANDDPSICAPDARMGLISPSICVSDDTHLRTSDALTEGTDKVDILSDETVTLKESQNACDLENVSQPRFICVPVTQMDAAPPAVPECGSCRLPWTHDVGRHRTALRRGMRVFICDGCREVQIAQKVGLATPA